MMKTPNTDPVAAAMQRVVGLHALELDLTARILELRQELAGAAAAITPAAAMASGDSVAAAIERKAVTAARIEATDEAINEARSQRRQTIRDVFVAEGEAARAAVADERRALEQHEARVAALLAELEQLQGCAYHPSYKILGSGGQLGRATPASDRMRRDVEARERDADNHHRRSVIEHGHLRARSRDELLAAVRALPATTIGPRLDAVIAWCDERPLPPGASYALIWSRGTIDHGDGVVVPEPMKTTPPALR
jgi:hypothetical protein